MCTLYTSKGYWTELALLHRFSPHYQCCLVAARLLSRAHLDWEIELLAAAVQFWGAGDGGGLNLGSGFQFACRQCFTCHSQSKYWGSYQCYQSFCILNTILQESDCLISLVQVRWIDRPPDLHQCLYNYVCSFTAPYFRLTIRMVRFFYNGLLAATIKFWGTGGGRCLNLGL